MKFLFVLNDPPYGTERSYNGLRLVLALAKQGGVEQRVFLMGDAVGCAKAGQTTAEGYYNLERMVRGTVTRGIGVGTCGTCMDARGVTEAELVEGVKRSSMAELAAWSAWADKILVF